MVSLPAIKKLNFKYQQWVTYIYLRSLDSKKSFDMILNLIQEISWDTRHDKHE